MSWAAAQTLKEAVELTVKSNPEVLASASRRLASDARLKEARAGYFPRVDLAAGKGRERLDDATSRLYGLNNTTFNRNNANVTLSQMLFDGFAVASEVDRQKARTRSSAYLVWATAEDLGLQAAGVYLEVLRRQETVAISLENVRNHQRIYDMIRRRTEGGLGRRSDLELAASRLASAKANLKGEEGNLRDAEAAFLRVVGSPPRGLARPGPSLGKGLDTGTALDALIDEHPAVRASAADVAAAEALHKGAQAALSPRLDLELMANQDKDIVRSRSEDYTAMLRLRYNLFRGGADAARISETRYQILEANEVLRQVRRQVVENVTRSFSALETARDRVADLTAYVDSSRVTKDDYAKQFNLGQRSLLDLLNAENEHASARSALVSDQYAQLLGENQVMASLGKLLEYLGIALPAEAQLAAE